MRAGFLMPLGCFAFIAFYGFSWRKFYRHDLESEQNSAPAPTH
jgi:hypothetical protein